jgi:hypothetical protein
MTNGKKKRNGARRRNRRRNPAPVGVATRKHNRRRNPRGRRVRRNPNVAGFDLMQIAKVGAGAIVGGIGTRAITQKVLGDDKNKGVMGYGANLLTAIALGWLGAKVNSDFGLGVIAGGVANTLQRIWDEQVAKVSPSATPALQGIGDASFSDSGLGDYVSATWPTVQVGGAYAPAAALPAAPGTASAPAPVAAANSRFDRGW